MIDIIKKYKNVYLLESRSYWKEVSENFDLTQDIVFTFDFGLKNLVENLGGKAFYIDSLCSPDEMQENNLLAAEFFKKWHYDENGNDIFHCQDVSFGFAFRIEIWSEFLYYVRLRANLEKVKKLSCENFYVLESSNVISSIMHDANLSFVLLDNKPKKMTSYYFDIHQYLYDALHALSWRNIFKNSLVKVFSYLSYYLDSVFINNRNEKTVYAQIYHPTEGIVDYFKKIKGVKVVTSSLSKSKNWRTFIAQRLIPIRGNPRNFKRTAELLMHNFYKRKKSVLVLADGTDVTDGSYRVIETKITPLVPKALQILDSVNHYFKNNQIHLEIMIANLGLLQTIVDCVLKKNGIPSYLIINGLLGGEFCDEGKYATYINCYSKSIKQKYYNNAENVLCLGDPRMDRYMSKLSKRTINRESPIITIGTSGFNNLDLISYVAVEFEFMYEVLTSFQELKNEGQLFSIIIKVRPNGFLEQYKSFVSEYFPDLEIKFIKEVPISDVLVNTDFYISIYSQTLFEASCLGIPAIYYKKDKEYLDPPFDGKSELVTVNSVQGLKEAFLDFKKASNRYDDFLRKDIMEKYVGPLDGSNLQRNLSFIERLIDQPKVIQELSPYES